MRGEWAIPVVAIAALALFAVPPAMAAGAATLVRAPIVAAGDGTDLDRRLALASEVYDVLVDAPDGKVPDGLLRTARCIAVIPGVLKAAFLFGGRYGAGVASCRVGKGNAGGWSAPVFIRLFGGSWGFQIGASSADFVLFFMSERGSRALLESRLTLGADASVAAGPVGRTAEAGTDVTMRAEIYTYARTRGLFAGISFEGAHLAVDDDANARYYGRAEDADAILFEGAIAKPPSSGAAFLARLDRHRG